MTRALFIFLLITCASCVSTDKDPLGDLVEKQGELNLNKKSDPVERWLDDY